MQHSDVSYKLNVKYKKPDKRLTLYLSIYIKFRIKKQIHIVCEVRKMTGEGHVITEVVQTRFWRY